MRKSIISGAVLGFLLLGFALPGTAFAKDDDRACSNIGTWFGVVGLGDTILTNWSGTTTGKTEKMGSVSIDFPTFDPSFADVAEVPDVEPFISADYVGALRGNWKRIGKNEFEYSFMGLAFKASGEPAYIARISGTFNLVENCQYQYIMAAMEVFLPEMSPFDSEPIAVIPLGAFYAYRAQVDLWY